MAKKIILFVVLVACGVYVSDTAVWRIQKFDRWLSEDVMAAQTDLVESVEILKQIVCVKGFGK